MNLRAGSRLGPYEILAPLGAGGMGEVFRARDIRLGREVAIKVLPASFSQDADRLRRFEQEAQAASALNHPNILAIFDVGTHQGAPYVVSELLEGETLGERLAGASLSARKAVDYAIQIAEGLAAAHEKGIVHRDLKPENLFLTKDGRVKILDFGLAKLTRPEVPSGPLTEAPTEAPRTEPGVVMGTIGYMSPEQVRGQPADPRSDIFAFGAVLYEMLAGRRAFQRESAVETMNDILKEDPPELSAVKPDLPLALERVVNHCLEKNPAERFQSVRDLAFDLEALSGISGPSSTSAALVPERSRSLRRALGRLGMVLAALGLGFAFGRYVERRPAPSSPVRVHRLTDFAGLEEFPAVSPDGKSVAFVADIGGRRQIWVRLIAGGAPLQLTRDPSEHQFPRWSHDSNSLIYYSPPAGGKSEGTIWEISALGGAPRRIASSIGGADLSHDGKRIVFFQLKNGHVEAVVAARDGSARELIAKLEPGYHTSIRGGLRTGNGSRISAGISSTTTSSSCPPGGASRAR